MDTLPDGGPQPIPLCQLRNNLHSAIFDRLLALCGETSGPNGREDLSGGIVTPHRARAPVRKVGRALFRKGAASVGGQVQNSVVEKLSFSVVGVFEGQGRDDVKAFGVNVGVSRIGGRPVKGTRSRMMLR
jgi:hypothetical protein